MVTGGLGTRGLIKRSEVKMSMRLLITGTSVAKIGNVYGHGRYMDKLQELNNYRYKNAECKTGLTNFDAMLASSTVTCSDFSEE